MNKEIEILKNERAKIHEIIESHNKMYIERLKEIDDMLHYCKTEEARKHIGKCFKYDSGGSYTGHWDVFYKILDVKKDKDDLGYFLVLKVEKTNSGEIKIELLQDGISYSAYGYEGRTPISNNVFEEKFNKLLLELTGEQNGNEKD